MRSGQLLAACLTTLMLGACAAPQEAPPPALSSSLRIDGRDPASWLAAGERARIDRRIPAEYRGQVLAAEALGTVIYRHAQLATRAARLIAAKGGRSPLPGEPAGWLAAQVAGRLGILFLVETKDGVAVAAEVRERSGSARLRLQRWHPVRALTPRERVLWRARQLAFSARIRPCAKRYDPVVVPIHAAGADQIYVYLLPASEDARQIFLGGYYRIAISADGDRIVATHAFTHACMGLRRRDDTVAASVSELVSATPTPPQIYASLQYRMPIYVATVGDRLAWKIEHGRVTLLRSLDGR